MAVDARSVKAHGVTASIDGGAEKRKNRNWTACLLDLNGAGEEQHMSSMPEVSYQNGPCPGCGARDMDEADRMCRPQSDQTGERYCSGRFNEHGMSEIPTPESLKAIDDWCGEQGRLEEATEANRIP